MFNNSQVNARALAFPSLKINGKKLKPVVVKTQQGATPTGDSKQEELAPAGPQDLEAGNSGGWFKNFNLPWGRGKKNEPQDDGKKFPLRIFHLVDVSSSMESQSRRLTDLPGEPTRLEYVKQSIKKLLGNIPKDLKAGIEHVLIPYSEESEEVQVFSGKDENAFKKALDSLGKNYGTNISKPIESVIDFIQEAADEQKRNLAILFSDGEHMPRKKGAASKAATLAKFSELEDVNSGVFNVGISDEYKRNFMLGALRNAKLGGLAHIPNQEDDLNIYQKVLPEFIRDLTTAPQFPVISFNNYFNKVVNLAPTARQIEISQTDTKTQEKTDLKEHFESVTGYQNESFSVGFIEEDQANEAQVFKTVKEAANSKSIDESEELVVQEFDQAILDPSERKQYKQYLFTAIKNLLIESDTPAQDLKLFMEENQIPSQMRKDLEKALNNFERENFNIEESLSYLAGQSVAVPYDHTIADQIEVPMASPDINGLETMRHPNDSNTVVNFSKMAEQIEVNGGDSIAEIPNREIDELKITLEYMSGEKYGHFQLKEGETKVFGRDVDNVDLPITDPSCSRRHAEISLKKGKVFIKDLDSRNGTYLNQNRSPVDQSEGVQVKPNDLISFGNKSRFRVKFKSS